MGSLAVGDVVLDRYRIDAVLGEGGMGVVYRAEHLHLRKPFAVKVLLPEWSSMPEVVARFEREAVAAGSIDSPHVAAATDSGRLPNGSFFLVMEYVKGRTLRTALEAAPLDPARAVHILRGMAAALHAAHELGIVHRDMKPENIMLIERDGDPDFVKVLDFGIAKVTGFGAGAKGDKTKALTQVGAIIGTPTYMSPEQAIGQAVDARTDLYSAGVICFEMLTGHCPFEGDAVTVLRQRVMVEAPGLPPEVTAKAQPGLGAVLARLLARLPEDRFATAAELMMALDDSASAPSRPSLESVQAMTTPAAHRVSRSVMAGVEFVRHGKRGPIVVGTVAVALIAMLVAVVAFSGGSHAEPSTAGTPAADSAAAFVPTSTAPDLSSAQPAASADVPPVTVLPPPPAPSSSATGAGTQPSRSSSGRPASSQAPATRRTGPGGIYIPPPSQWFK
jgi:serine/threonine protein kinase